MKENLTTRNATNKVLNKLCGQKCEKQSKLTSNNREMET